MTDKLTKYQLIIQDAIESICDAYGKGFDQVTDDVKNPYVEGSDWYKAYEYGREVHKKILINETMITPPTEEGQI